jgi:hypothetical protein
MKLLAAVIVMAAICATAAANASWMRPDLEPMPTPDQVGQTWVEIDGQIYGAQPGELGPIGGAEGYSRIITEGDFNVKDAEELLAALAEVQSGQVIFLDPAGDYDFTTFTFAEENFVIGIPGGVTLASNRGQDGSRGAVIYSDNYATRPLMITRGPNVRLTGLWLRGPDPYRRLEHHRRAYTEEGAPGSSYYYKFPVSEGITTKFDGLEVDNCEITGWSHAGIHLSDGVDHHIHHNYIHHCQMNGLGYGVCHGYGDRAVSLTEYNIFDANRHSIAGTGKPGNAYIARHNVELGVSLSHCFDMHGGSDRRDGTSIAGDRVTIHNNTFRAPIRAIAIRGVPQEPSEIYNNWFYQSEPGPNTIMPWPVGGETNVIVRDNAYGLESPALADERKADFREAMDAALAAVEQRNTSQARVWLSQALDMAATDAERAAAHLHLGHCAMSDRLGYLAAAHYEQVLASADAAAEDRTIARGRLDRIRRAEADRPAREWILALEDNFDRDELGEHWKVLVGDWKVQDGVLRNGPGHSEVVITRPFPGMHRLEFEAMTDVQRPCDFTSAIHTTAAVSSVRNAGYLLQFGGAGNTLNRILRNDQQIEDRAVQRFIEPGRWHTVVAELDGDTVRLIVDGKTIVEAYDRLPLVGEGHDRVGLYLYNVTHIRAVRVYTSEP